MWLQVGCGGLRECCGHLVELSYDSLLLLACAVHFMWNFFYDEREKEEPYRRGLDFSV